MIRHPEACIVVEQLNTSQWHVLFPGTHGGGVTNWVDALAAALECARLDGSAVITRDWRGLTLSMLEASGANA